MFTELPNPLSKVEPDQKWAEPFADLLDEIYYRGYAKRLAEEFPETYQSEYYNFMLLYDGM